MDIITYALLKKGGGGGGGESTVVVGYYNATDGEFYEDSSYTTPIIGKENHLYVSNDNDELFMYNGSNYVLITGGSSIQITNFPTASVDELGKIYQYIGNSTLEFTNGCFYKCVQGDTPGTYKWEPIGVEDSDTYEDDPIDFNNW